MHQVLLPLDFLKRTSLTNLARQIYLQKEHLAERLALELLQYPGPM